MGIGENAILAVSFGTSSREALRLSIEAIEADLSSAFPDSAVFRAFTSGRILERLRRDGAAADSLAGTAARLRAAGVRTLLCQPIFIMEGSENRALRLTLRSWLQQGWFDAVRLGAPLLSSPEDYRQTARALSREFPPQDGAAIVFMGHGSSLMGGDAYQTLDACFQRESRADILVGCMAGDPGREGILRRIRRAGYRRVRLAPLLITSGCHAHRELSGDEDSWENFFRASGLEVALCLSGLGEFSGIRRIFVSHAVNSSNLWDNFLLAGLK